MLMTTAWGFVQSSLKESWPRFNRLTVFLAIMISLMKMRRPCYLCDVYLCTGESPSRSLWRHCKDSMIKHFSNTRGNMIYLHPWLFTDRHLCHVLNMFHSNSKLPESKPPHHSIFFTPPHVIDACLQPHPRCCSFPRMRSQAPLWRMASGHSTSQEICTRFVFCCNYDLVDFTYMIQGLPGTGAIVWLPQCQWNNPESYG